MSRSPMAFLDMLLAYSPQGSLEDPFPLEAQRGRGMCIGSHSSHNIKLSLRNPKTSDGWNTAHPILESLGC